jgi:hypothetical protein
MLVSEGDIVEFEISPAHQVHGKVIEIINYPDADLDENYSLCSIEEDDGTIWTVSNGRIKEIVGKPQKAVSDYDRAMRGI